MQELYHFLGMALALVVVCIIVHSEGRRPKQLH